MSRKDIFLYAEIGLALLALLIMAFVLPGTGDEGDSVTHYLISKYAFEMPHNFFDHWGKPLFVLFSTCFAQFGFVGIKIFNVLSTTTAIYFACRTAQLLKIPNVQLLPAILFFSPMYIVLTLSGLTEPFSAAVLMVGIYLLIANKATTGVILLSFLPFIRSEGLVILGVVTIYLLYSKQWRLLPLLAVGHLVYAVAGYPEYHSLWWVFSKIPYATLNSEHYGSGDLLYFVNNFHFIMGYVIKWLIGLGFIYLLIAAYQQFVQIDKKQVVFSAELLLIYGIFSAFFVAHTLFWYFGIFGSAGMLRVMITIIPLGGIIALRGANVILGMFNKKYQTYLQVLMAIPIIAYPFWGDKPEWNYQQFDFKADQRAQFELAKYVRQTYPNYNSYHYYYEAPFISIPFNHNFNLNIQHPNEPFAAGTQQHIKAIRENAELQKPAFVIWDDWYAKVEGGVTWEAISTDTRLKILKEFEQKDQWGTPRKTVLFVTN